MGHLLRLMVELLERQNEAFASKLATVVPFEHLILSLSHKWIASKLLSANLVVAPTVRESVNHDSVAGLNLLSPHASPAMYSFSETQSNEPFLAVVIKSGHGRHRSVSGTSAYLPTSHDKHEDAPALDSVPFGQARHSPRTAETHS